MTTYTYDSVRTYTVPLKYSAPQAVKMGKDDVPSVSSSKVDSRLKAGESLNRETLRRSRVSGTPYWDTFMTLKDDPAWGDLFRVWAGPSGAITEYAEDEPERDIRLEAGDLLHREIQRVMAREGKDYVTAFKSIQYSSDETYRQLIELYGGRS
jgi:hypothetical protein